MISQNNLTQTLGMVPDYYGSNTGSEYGRDGGYSTTTATEPKRDWLDIGTSIFNTLAPVVFNKNTAQPGTNVNLPRQDQGMSPLVKTGLVFGGLGLAAALAYVIFKPSKEEKKK